MNVMLLAMSTYPYDMKRCVASYDEESENYSYFSQLEPGCKHFICKLAGEMNKGFDKIIVLCTDEALTAPKDNKNTDGKPNPKTKFIKNGENTVDISAISPYGFFKDRMISFIRNDNKAFEYEEKLGLDMIGISRFEHPEYYADTNDLFIPVRIEKDELEITSSIRDVIRIIDEIPKKKGDRIFLYLNAQGGARKNIQIVNTVLNMLQSRKYSLAEVSVIEYNLDHNSSRYRMLDVTGSYIKNDLAAAMNAFLQYGRADMFVDYYRKYKKKRGIDQAPEDDIVEKINKISDAMLLCDIDSYLTGITDLKKSISDYEKNTADSKDSFFELIVNDIQKSYRELFDSSDMIADLDVLVDWCLKRKLLQQAVTILESKTPEFVFDYGIFYVPKTNASKDGLKQLRANILPNQVYKFDHPKYYLFNKFCLLNAYKNDNSGIPYNVIVKSPFSNKDDWFIEMLNGTYSYGFKEKQAVDIELYNNLARYADIGSADNVKAALARFRELIKGYRKICYIRNDLNHGNIKASYEYLQEQVKLFNNTLKEFKKIRGKTDPEASDFFNGNDLKN